MIASDWAPVFAYLENEARFQAAAGAVTGAAAAWWLKTLLSPAAGAAPERHPRTSRIAAALLAGSSFLCLLDQGTRFRQSRWTMLHAKLSGRVFRTKREKAVALYLFSRLIVESSRRINFRKRIVSRSVLGVLRSNFGHLLNRGSRISSHDAAGVKVAVHEVVGMLHGENLIFLGQFSEVTFNSVLLHCVLIALIDP